MKRLLLILSFLISSCSLSAQTDSLHIRVSLLTCSPGEELYATFGHTAIRIYDSANHADYVYNYGTFNFGDDGFYLKFMRGKLMYYLNIEPFSDPVNGGFKETYEFEHRSITEQVLNFSYDEKKGLIDFLRTNMMPQNRFYKYDFFFDNCTTRARDLIMKLKAGLPPLKAAMPEGTRFRQAIHFYLDKNDQHWSKLGIDILLGQPCDAVMSGQQMQFLPDNLMKALDSSNAGQRLVLQQKEILGAGSMTGQLTVFTPVLFFWLLTIIIVLLSLVKRPFVLAFLQGFDGLLFFFTGLVGILLVFMWTATDHQMCRNNFNLLWALPTHFVIAFLVNSKRGWVKKYFGLVALLMTVLLLAWFFLPQSMNNALIPLVLLIIYRSAVKYVNPRGAGYFPKA